MDNFLDNFEMIKDRLIIRLVSQELENDLDDSVCDLIGDIALVAYIRIGQTDDRLLCAKVKNSMLNVWGVSKKMVMKIASLNSKQKNPAVFMDVMKKLFNDDYNGESIDDYNISSGVLTTLTTYPSMNGAVALFYDGVADKISSKYSGHDFYIAFTSVHEAMIHDVNEIELSSLKSVLKETVDETCTRDCYLTRNIYRYDSILKKIVMEP